MLLGPVSYTHLDVYKRQVVSNVGNLMNQGFEVTLGAVPFAGKFSWNMDFTLGYNKNEITNLAHLAFIQFRRKVENAGTLGEQDEVRQLVCFFRNGVHRRCEMCIRDSPQADGHRREDVVEHDGDGKLKTG